MVSNAISLGCGLRAFLMLFCAVLECELIIKIQFSFCKVMPILVTSVEDELEKVDLSSVSL